MTSSPSVWTRRRKQPANKANDHELQMINMVEAHALQQQYLVCVRACVCACVQMSTCQMHVLVAGFTVPGSPRGSELVAQGHRRGA